MNEMTAVTITKHLPIKLDQYRKNQFQNEMVEARMEELRVTDQLKHIQESLKALIKEAQKKQNDAARALHAGIEMVPVSCEHRVDLDRNKMVTIRMDTLAEIEERALTADEMKYYGSTKKVHTLKP